MSKKIKKAKLESGKFTLIREEDNAGDSGPLLVSLKFPKNKKVASLAELEPVGKNGEIHVGCRIKCGSSYARSYQAQDWWLTSDVVEIIKVNKAKTEVIFRTLNSIYTATSF